jgi:ribose transport system permease protein
MALRDLVVRERDLAGSGDSRPKVIGWGEAVGREGGGLVVLVILFGALALASESFLTGGNMANLSRQWAVYGIIAIGELLVILTKGIDLSVGSVVGLTGAVAAQLLVAGWPVPLAVLCAVGAGAGVGVVNGVLVAHAGLPPFIVTLGMMGAARGLVLVITNANTIQPLPEGFASIANDSLLGIPHLLWITVIVIIAIGFVLRRTVFGRYVYATGSNSESARLSGVPVPRVLVSVYAMSGLLAGIGGVLLASRLDAGVPTMGESYELDAIAACVIGGASLFGAKGSALGAATGALITSTLNNGGNLLGVNSFYLRIAIGVLILLAVSFDQVQGRLLRGGEQVRPASGDAVAGGEPPPATRA